MAVIHSFYKEAGTVTINEETCKVCGQCAKVCPADVLFMEDNRVKINENSLFGCIACGHCMMVCSTNSICVSGRGISKDDIVDLPLKEKKAAPEMLYSLMQSRRSIRHFKSTPIESSILEDVVKAASTAPMGIPPWDIGCVIVQGEEQVQKLSSEIVEGYRGMRKLFKPWLLKLFKPFMKNSTYDMFQSFIIPLANVYVDSKDQGKDTLTYNAPAVIIFYQSEYADEVDSSIAATYAMLYAESLGLGTTIIGGIPPILQRNKELSNRLGIPKNCKASMAMILGYPSVHFKHTIKRRFLDTKFAKI